MKQLALILIAVSLVALSAGTALAQGQNQDEPSLFDAWWARVFCLYLLIPVAAFIRRLFAGWLNFLGIDEEKWAGLGMGMLGGLVGLGMAAASFATAGTRGLGWLLGSTLGNRGLDWARQGPATGPGGGGAVSGPTSPTSPTGPTGPTGMTGPTGQIGEETGGAAATGPAREAAGDGVTPPDDVKGAGLPEKGSRYEADPERARRQAVQDWLQQFRLRRENLVQDRRWGTIAGSIAADAGRAAGMAVGALAAIGLGGMGGGGTLARDLVHTFGEMGAAPGRLWEMYRQTPPPRYPQSLLDGARWR